ncbi:hypothetical protein MSAN_01459800 [Mycena sanguinolenta]|uniref:Uncharacterized protein n=1 Tax=Mycena sanguinolenta TaxID=230812 RepID=A0A8H6YC99_9AGAR|nr:hypothetical protein MSAN_01459800 [Mycena sanguinolenta]
MPVAVSRIPSSSRPTKSAGGEPGVTHLIDKLDSLAKFYQKQLEWVDSSTRVGFNAVEPDSDADDELSEAETQSYQPTSRPLTSAALRRMHWRRQMRLLESKLSGRAHKRRPRSASRSPVSSKSSRREAEERMGSQHILNIFGQIIGARMESCRRVQKLVAFNRFGAKPDAVRSPDPPRVGDPDSSDEIML